MTTVFYVLHRLATIERPAATVEDGAQRMPLSRLGAAVDRRAAALFGKGLRPGDRALIAQGNSVDWIVSALAVMRLRAIAVPINPGATPRERRSTRASSSLGSRSSTPTLPLRTASGSPRSRRRQPRWTRIRPRSPHHPARTTEP